MIRTPQALIPYLLAAAAVFAGCVWHLGDMAGGLGKVITTGQAQIGGPFALIDQNGHARSDKDFRGQWMLVYFGYSHCPDVCPLTLEMMGDAMARLGSKAARVTPIFITVDPARDTPSVLKAYVGAFGKRFVGLTGDAKSVAAAAHAYHVYAKRRDLPGGDYAMDHSSVIYLMDPQGRFAMDYDEVNDPSKIAADIARRM